MKITTTTLLALALLFGAGVARAEDAPPPAAAAPVAQPAVADPVTITLPRATLIAIGQGVMKLPYDVAAPILNSLQAQLSAADKAAAEPAAPAPPQPDAKKKSSK